MQEHIEKMMPKGSKRVPKGRHGVPRWAKMCERAHQEGPRDTKRSQNWPQGVPRGSKRVPTGAKREPMGGHEGPKGSKMSPKGSQNEQKSVYWGVCCESGSFENQLFWILRPLCSQMHGFESPNFHFGAPHEPNHQFLWILVPLTSQIIVFKAKTTQYDL